MPERPLAGVLFDLDGTLLDTAPDLIAALDHALATAGRPPVDPAAARGHVSHGAAALIEHGFGISREDPEFERHRRILLDHYQENLARNTRPFPGMTEVLDWLERTRIPWGVVTNKPTRFTYPLLKALGLHGRAAAVISGDTVPEKKPHPAPLLAACRRMGVKPATCVYIGDAQRDIEAGRRAGMWTVAALFGYLAAPDRPESWGADHLIHTPEELTDWIRNML